MKGKEVFRSESTNFSVEVESRTIDFWRGEYAKRHVYIREGENYPAVKKAMKALSFVGKRMEELFGSSPDIDASDYEYYVLVKIDQELIKDIHLEKIVPANSVKKLQKLLIQAHSYSHKYNYVISDLSLGNNISHRKLELLQIIASTDPNYYEDISINSNPKENKITLVKEFKTPKHYGANAKPHHNVHIIDKDTSIISNSFKINPDIAFAIKNIGDDNFNINSTIGMIKCELFNLRMDHLEIKIQVAIDDLAAAIPHLVQVKLRAFCYELIDLTTEELFRTIAYAKHSTNQEEIERYKDYINILEDHMKKENIKYIKKLLSQS